MVKTLTAAVIVKGEFNGDVTLLDRCTIGVPAARQVHNGAAFKEKCHFVKNIQDECSLKSCTYTCPLLLGVYYYYACRGSTYNRKQEGNGPIDFGRQGLWKI